MANNRLYIVDEKSKTAVMIAKSMGAGWYPWFRSSKTELYEKMNAVFGQSSEMGRVGEGTDLVLKTEFEIDESNYNIIRLDDH